MTGIVGLPPEVRDFLVGEVEAAVGDATWDDAHDCKKQTEYFLNCQHLQDDPLSADIETGCSLIMRSFRLAKSDT